MNREDVNNLVMSKVGKTKFLILELITGFGKTAIAINVINHICNKVYKFYQEPTSVLILVSKTVHKQTWKDEFNKWGGVNTDLITIECYESLKKYKDRTFDIVILDECQHLSEKRATLLESITINEICLGLSATIKRDLKYYFTSKYNAEIISCGLKEAVEADVLPEPKVYLLPLNLDTKNYSYKVDNFGKTIITTQKGYYLKISSKIEYLKSTYFRGKTQKMKNLWLSSAGSRLKWLSEQKESIVLSLLDYFKNYRTLTFCNNIEQSKRLGKYNINSKNKKSIENLTLFNANKIKHITAVNILNEGVNLYNCRIGIFCNLNNSEIITKQRVGRMLRHKSPIVILPFFKDTREEELVLKMIQEYPKESIIEVNNIKDIKL